MPFLLAAAGPLAASAIGATGLTGALLQGAIGLGLSLAATALTSKTTNTGSAFSGTRINLRVDPNAPRQAIFGEQLTFGNLAFWHVSDNRRVLSMVIDVAHHKCEALCEEIWVYGRKYEWDSETGIVSGFGGKLKVRWHSGAADQVADATLVANSGGRWKATSRGAHVAYCVVEATADETYFQSGIPEIGFVVRGAQLYDRRKDTTAGGSGLHRIDNPATWAWTANPAVIVDNLLTGIRPGGKPLMGMHVARGVNRYDDFAAAANACEEQIALAGGGTEDRYKCHVVFETTTTNQTMLETALASMAGKLIEVGGLYRLQAGVTQPIVDTLSDADLYIAETLASAPLLTRGSLVNGVLGSFADPAHQYQPVPLPARQSSGDVTQDRGSWTKTLDLTAVTSRTQAQRIMEIERKRARRMLVVTCTLRAFWSKLEPGDWITFTSERRGWVNRTFEVAEKTDNEDLSVDVTLRAVDSEIDDWSSGDELADTTTNDLGPAGPSLAVLEGFALETVLVPSGGSSERPGLHATWTPPDDFTIISIAIQFREIGSDIVLDTNPVLDPSAGSHTWVSGVQGDTDYQARALIKTRPERSTEWTVWTSAPATTDPQVVNVGTIDIEVAPDSVTPAMLSMQARLELSLITDIATAQGSVANRLQRIADDLQILADANLSHRRQSDDAYATVKQTIVEQVHDRRAFAQFKVEVQSALEGINGPVAEALLDLQTRVEDTEEGVEANAAAILAVTTEVDETVATAITTLSTRITATEEGIATAEAQAFMGVNVDGNAAYVDIYGNSLGSQIVFAAEDFRFRKPDGTAEDMFILTTIDTEDGPLDVAVLNVDELLLPGSIKAEHLDVTSIATLYISDPDNTFYKDFANGRDGRTDGEMTVDYKNKVFEIIFD